MNEDLNENNNEVTSDNELVSSRDNFNVYL